MIMFRIKTILWQAPINRPLAREWDKTNTKKTLSVNLACRELVASSLRPSLRWFQMSSLLPEINVQTGNEAEKAAYVGRHDVGAPESSSISV
jgi:hypothetical protein